MAFDRIGPGLNRFGISIALRLAILFVSILATAWMVANTTWYVNIAICAAASVAQTVWLVQLVTRSSRALAQFLDALAADDMSQTYPSTGQDGPHRDLRAAMGRVVARLQSSRSEREEQAQYLRALLAHVPVALISVDARSQVQLLNSAARRLFETEITRSSEFARHGDSFAVSLESLRPGCTAVLKMERTSGPLLLKAAMTEFVAARIRRRLISLQNIENEMSAQELAAWQTVIRVLAHEIDRKSVV